MSIFRSALQKRGDGIGATAESIVADRMASRRSGIGEVNEQTALAHSAVYACLKLRASIVSITPLDVYRKVGGIQVEVPKPPVLRFPGGERCSIVEWLFSTQFDIDRYGNVYGLITKKDGNGLPAEIELQKTSTVVTKGKGMQVTKYRIGNKDYEPSEVWHEKGDTVPGLPVGISPLHYAKMTIGGYLAAQKYASDWFNAGPRPKAILKNTAHEKLSPTATYETKQRFMENTADGSPFVTGSSWEYTAVQQDSASEAFLEEMKYGVVDVCRYLGVPAEMIDGGVKGSQVEYANVTMNHLQFLIRHLAVVYVRREEAFTNYMLAQPRYVKFNTDATLRMDPKTREELLIKQVAGKLRAPSEARALSDLPPYTEEQFAEFERLGFTKAPTISASAG